MGCTLCAGARAKTTGEREIHMDFEKMKDAAADAVGKAKDFATDAADKAKDLASGGVEGAKDAAAGVGDKLGGIKDALKDEEKTDAVLDKAADAVNKVTGGKVADHVEKARQFADDRLGDEAK